MRVEMKALISILIIVLGALSSARVLDDYVDRYTDESIRNAALTYASARGINALVSVLQSSEVEVGVIVSGSMTIGEVLDPLNDMIERFSSVMAWVLASLAAQKVLLLVASHKLFVYLVAVLGVASLLLLHYSTSSAQNLVFRCFLVAVFIRFALALVVALNSGADYLFLDQQLRENDREVEQFQSNLMQLESGGDSDGEDLRDSVIAFWRSLSMDELNQKISRGIESFINLISIYLLKTILFPLGFFYAMVFIIRRLWRVDLNPAATP
jgi:hypothetical protein